MRKEYYAIYDNLGQKYNVPVLFDSEPLALRWFTGVVNEKQNDVIYNNPGDFELHKLGVFDDNTGDLFGEHNKVATALSVKKGE